MAELPDLDAIKKYAWHLKVAGGYVMSPTPAVVGLDERTVIASNDAAALYPTVGVFSNIGYDSLRDRIYDASIIRAIIGLIEKVYKARDSNPGVVDSAVFGFKNALGGMLVDYFKRKSVQNKGDSRTFTLEYYPILLKRILDYEGELNDIFNPKTDRQYYLLKSCLYPILETITWLSPQNKGYSQTVVDFIFFNDNFDSQYKEFYVFREINTTKTYFQVLDIVGVRDLFSKRVLNSYGTLYNLHRDNLSFDVEIIKDSLQKRRTVKNQQLVLKAILSQYQKLSEDIQSYFYNPDNGLYLSKEQADEILTAIKDDQPREQRIQSLTEVELQLDKDNKAFAFLDLRVAQLGVLQLGIKVALNSGYGIYAMPTWLYASPLIGNSFTNAGKVYGTKLFQAVSIDILEKLENKKE